MSDKNPDVSQIILANTLFGNVAMDGIEKPIRAVEAVLDSTPIVGHVKGIVHDVCGDRKAAERAFTAATRTTAVVGAGAGGLLVGGPVTGAALGVTTGVTWDTTTAIATEGKETPGVTGLIADPNLKTALNAGLSLAGDGVAGFVGPKMVGQMGRRTIEAGTSQRFKEVINSKLQTSKSSTAESQFGNEIASSEAKNLETREGRNNNF